MMAVGARFIINDFTAFIQMKQLIRDGLKYGVNFLITL